MLATGETQALDMAGEPVMTLEALSWIGSREVSDMDGLPQRLACSLETSATLLPMPDMTLPERTIEPLPAPLYFEDLPVGTKVVSDWRTIDGDEIAQFHASFDTKEAETTGPASSVPNPGNPWLNFGLAVRLGTEALYSRSEIMGGGGVLGVRWPDHLRAGDRLRVALTVTEARRLRSRPELGLVGIHNMCVNQRGELICLMQVMSFMRLRAP
jgi:acyl dehydratase